MVLFSSLNQSDVISGQSLTWNVVDAVFIDLMEIIDIELLPPLVDDGFRLLEAMLLSAVTWILKHFLFIPQEGGMLAFSIKLDKCYVDILMEYFLPLCLAL